MRDDRWIVIPNWGKFQHYGARGLVWIKVYTELNSRDDWWTLSWSRRGILITVWVEYARSRGRLRCDQLQKLGKTWLRPGDLEALNEAGFIEFSASAPQRFSASPEKKRIEKNPLTPTDVGARTNNTNPRANNTNPRAIAQTDKERAHTELLTQATDLADMWAGDDSAEFDEKLDWLEVEHDARLTHLERDSLWEKAFSLGA